MKDFWDRQFLRAHCQSILDFYQPAVVDPVGGFIQNFRDDGSSFDPGFRQLVSSTRMVVNYSLASRLFPEGGYGEMARHGLAYLNTVHWQPDSELFAWTLQDHQPLDLTQQAYGYAFILLAYASVKKAGLDQVDEPLETIWRLLEERFWQPAYGLYADEVTADGKLSDYRGQNSNMHLCEAMIAAYEATGEARYLDRAKTLARNIAVRQADLTNGLIWEHFTPEFGIDWDYNRNDPKNLYRPWGFQPGHQTEWSKLLLQLYRHAPEPWLAERAAALFDWAWSHAWDDEFGGLVYGIAPGGDWCDDDKYFWVQAESFAAAALLWEQTGETRFKAAYNDLWQYAWSHFVDHQYGAWYRVLYRDNRRVSDRKSEAGAKCDYHTLGACAEVLRVLGESF